MVDDTSPNLGVNVGDYVEHNQIPVTSTKYSCTTCQIIFQNGSEQRIHMKESWHVHNIKRRIASLPPVPMEEFQLPVITKDIATRKASSATKICDPSICSAGDALDDTDEDEDEDTVSPFLCLFCHLSFASHDAGLSENLRHMRTSHGMFISDPEMVVDMQCFVGYLATEVRVWHECLYCGATKPSTMSVQSHMRDKGHCLLNLEREPELLDFWERPAVVGGNADGELKQRLLAQLSTAEEIHFTSGKVIGSRHAAPSIKKTTGKLALRGSAVTALGPLSGPAEPPRLDEKPQLTPSSRQVVRREEMSLIGVSVRQRQALVMAEKKAQRSEAVARRAREWVYAKGANSQKFDQLDNQMKWGKQNHKLLPR